ncbi:MAG: SAVED domain-containing protein [Bacillota bacterium]
MAKPRKLSKADELLLWVSSGGICAYPDCKQRLVFEEAGKTFNVADKAHIIPHAAGGPRKEERASSKMTEDEISSAENLILLCKVHHNIVDTDPDRFTADMLREMKRKHEEWVAIRLSKVQTSIAILHKTKGPKTDAVLLADQLDLKVLGIASFHENLDDVPQINWDDAKKRNIEVFNEAMELLHTYEGVLFHIFPLSQIPLLIQLGNLLTDTVPIQVFQYDRETGMWVFHAPDTKVEELGIYHSLKTRNSTRLVVTLGISAVIHHEDVSAVISINDCDFLEITIREPVINRVLYQEHVAEVRNYFKSKVERLHQQHRYNEIHLFYAGPAGLAVELGRAVNRKMWPGMYLYHYDFRREPRYERAFYI